ncbi:MAG: anthranilate phosphoribosyltransferase [Synergistaceae bacterium]|nr:anthranilate phosphoribosyltransferase [Synergistaceae bacterium]
MKRFGAIVTRLIDGEDLSYQEVRDCFLQIVENRQTEMQQGAFLAAITAKGPTGEEIRAIMDSILEHDTNTVAPDVDGPIVESSGTGMDVIKTFNISTGASVVASACGVVIARHASRGLTSPCGAVDIAEKLGIDVEAPVDVIKNSIERAGIGIFNGGSPNVHPKALARILSQISFGCVLNTAASLANPARPTHAVRGVRSSGMVTPVAEIMRDIGYKRAVVVHGLQCDGRDGLDEAGTIGETLYAELRDDGAITEGRFSPEDFGLSRATPGDIRQLGGADAECARLTALIEGRGSRAESEIVALNSALIQYVSGLVSSLRDGVERSMDAMRSGLAAKKLCQWVSAQGVRETA